MNCHNVRNLLVSFLDGELSGVRKEEIEAHFKICAACRRERELFSQSWQMLDNYAAPKLKDDFTVSLMRKIHQEQAEIIKVSYRRPWFVLRPVVPVLASIIVLILTVSVFWKRPTVEMSLVKQVSSLNGKIVTVVNDDEIIKNLDILENADLLANIPLLSELEVVENLDDSTL
ncbi:MAG: zf-HC2 domain-containing protein [Candidatus Omnitrophota bacterium]